MSTFHSGFTGTATIGGNELAVVAWNVDPSVEVVEFKNSKTGQFAVKEATYKDCPFTIEVDFDFDDNPFAAPVSAQIGTILTNTKLYLNGTSGKYWDFPSSLVTKTPMRLDRAGKITTSIDLTNSGTFSYPT